MNSHQTTVGANQASASDEWRHCVSGPYRWTARARLLDQNLFEVISHSDTSYLQKPEADASSVVFRTELRGAPVVVKHYRGPGFIQRLKSFFRMPRARRAFQWALYLKERGISAVNPIAVGTRCCRPWESYLITEDVVGGRRIHDVVADCRSNLERRRVVLALARLMSQLHDAGLAHGDAHLANFLVKDAGSLEVIIVDLDGLRARATNALRTAASDLARLADYSPGTLREHLRFLATYVKLRRRDWSLRELLNEINKQSRGPGPLQHAR